MGGGYPPFNGIGHYDTQTRKLDVYFPGPVHAVQEPVFTPSGKEEGEGYVLALVRNFKTMSSELHLVSTADYSKPVAVIHLPLRLRAGLHGDWIPGQDLDLDFN
jgi:carotenoid cleavage dioxygenase